MSATKLKCLIVDDEEMSRATIEHFVQNTDVLELAGVCSNAIEAGNVLRKSDVDVLFLDVEMPEMNGLDLIKSLTKKPEIVLVTSKENYAVEAFEYSVTDYMVKPVEYSRFLKSVNKVKDKLNIDAQIKTPSSDDISMEEDEVFIKTDSKLVRIKYRDILFVEALADYAVINMPDAKHIIHSTMKKLEVKFPEADFTRVHRSYIVNLKKIEQIEDMNILIKGNHIPVGASYKDKFMRRLNLL